MSGAGAAGIQALQSEVLRTIQERKTLGTEFGIEIWQVEKSVVTVWPRKNHGTFFSDAAYVILHTICYEDDDRETKYHEIYFWVGQTCAPSDLGIAAAKAFEIDAALTSKPILAREVQRHESDSFFRLFPDYIFLTGGSRFLFNPSAPGGYHPRLLRVKTQDPGLVSQEKLDFSSLNEMESFILDRGTTLMIWHGRMTRTVEKHKASCIAQIINDQRGGSCKREVFDQGVCDEAAWWTALGNQGPIATTAPAHREDSSRRCVRRLMLVSEEAGKVQFAERAREPLLRFEMLTAPHVFLLDDGREVLIWVGSKASPMHKHMAMTWAVQYLVGERRPPGTPLFRILEGAYSDQVTEFFR
eukprot:m.229138 g.229138  ORF g.229138 m.229138 type:complete len:357 (-) comp17673_c0_seq1:69-1139(-)